MKRILQLFILGAMAFGTSYGSACGVGTLDTYTAAGFSCDMNFGSWQITFSNFTWVSATSASTIKVNPAQNANVGLGGFSFTQNQSLSFTDGFTLGYSAAATCLVGGLTCNLRGYAEQAFFPGSQGSPSISIVQANGPSPVILTFANQTSIQPNVFLAPTTFKMATFNGGQTLQSFESDVFGVIGREIPEPATLSLIGAGLLGLGVLRRRRT